MGTSRQHLISEVSTEQDLLVFDRDLREFLGQPEVLDYVVEPRITAVQVMMVYEKGALRSAASRTGQVTTSIKTILTVPLTFIPLTKQRSVPDYLEIGTDVYMETEAFGRLNQERAEQNLPSFSDPRAGVEDSLAQTDPRICARRPLNYFCSGTGKRADLQAATHYELMIALQELGLRVNRPHMKIQKQIQGVIEACRVLGAGKKTFPYPIEGAWIRVNSLDLQERLAGAGGKYVAVLRF